MPLRVNLAVSFERWKHFIEYACYIILFLFMVPIKYEGNKLDVEDMFEKYLKEYNKTYDNNTLYNLRMQAFENSLKSIEQLNSYRTESSAKYGLTKFSDMTPDEFLISHLRPNLSSRLFQHVDQSRRRRSTFVLPKKVDWREKRVVSPVINQKTCGACWAFAGIGMVESINAIKTGKFERLSVQQMIDCSELNDGCEGGDICSLLFWMKESKIKVVSEDNYPLILSTQTCHNTSGNGVELKDYGCQSFTSQENSILDFLAMSGPVAVAINAQPWQHYVGGVIQFHCDGKTTDLNHAVEIVGYDLTAKIPHYIVKNSWGEDWGENGYLNIAVGGNICGLAHEVALVAT